MRSVHRNQIEAGAASAKSRIPVPLAQLTDIALRHLTRIHRFVQTHYLSSGSDRDLTRVPVERAKSMVRDLDSGE
jgi:hypothetical protein